MTLEYEVLGVSPLDPRAEETLVRMRDGVRLATDVYLPTGHARVPVVLVRLPYDKCGRYTYMPQMAPYFNERGYAFVVQDVRGKFRSEGETVPFAHEVADGYDTLDWVVAQPWCDGHVGMWGDSYYGFTQWAAVASGHPALKAIVPRVTGTDFGVSNWWGDSVVLLYAAQYLAECWLDNLMYNFHLDWGVRPVARIFDEAFATAGKRSFLCDKMIGVQASSGLGKFAGKNPLDMLKIPVLHSVGWFDNVSPNSFADYEYLMGHRKQRPLQYLVGDAFDHEMYHLRHVPIKEADDHNANPAALDRLIPEILSPGLGFFDVFLKGRAEAVSIPRAKWFLGGVGWRTSSSWPPPEHQELRLYLGSPQRANQGVEGGTLIPTPERTPATVRWLHDPALLVPSSSEDPFALLHPWADERAVQGREDVLTFTGEVLSEPLDLAGPVSVCLSVGSTCSSMQVHAKLCDVFPDGSTHMLMRGEALVRRREYESPVEIRLSHTAYRLQAGHRLRLAIASSDYPLYLWHPGTDENPWLATKGVVNEQRLSTGGSYPSHVRLTTI